MTIIDNFMTTLQKLLAKRELHHQYKISIHHIILFWFICLKFRPLQGFYFKYEEKFQAR